MKEKEKQLAIFEQNVGKDAIPYIAIGGGKGGVGKTLITYLLAKRLAEKGKKVLVLDADMGLPDFYILGNIQPDYYLEDYVNGNATLDQVATEISENLYLISPKSGNDYLLQLDSKTAIDLLNKLEEFVVSNFDAFLIDLGAGIHKLNQLIFSSVHYPILVVVPNIMSIIDAYAMAKATYNNYRRNYYYTIVNMVKRKEDYKKTVNVLRKSLKTYHPNLELEGLGFIPYSEKLEQGEISQKIYSYVDQILWNLFKDIGFIKEEKRGFWQRLKAFFSH